MESVIPQPTLHDLAFVLFKRRWTILLLLLGTLLGTFVYLFLIREDVYAATSRLLVRIGREQAPPSTLLGNSPLMVSYRTSEVNSETEILQSSELLLKVIDDLHLDDPPKPISPPPGILPRTKYEVKRVVQTVKDWYQEILITVGLRERLTRRETVLDLLQKSLQVKAAKDSNVFVVALGTPYRKGGSMVLNHLLDEYLVYRQKIYQTKGFDFFREQVDRTRSELRDAERKVQEFENREKISLIGKQQEVLVDQINREQGLVLDLELERNQAAYKVRRLEEELKKADPNFGSIGDFPRESFQHNILAQLADLQREREKLRLTELDAGERVQNNRHQFQVLSGMLEANLRATLAEKEAKLTTRQGSLSGADSELRARHGLSSEWVTLKRRVADLEGSYNAYQRKLAESRVDDDLQTAARGNVTIIERPVDPIVPVGLRKTTILGITMLVALFMALAWVAIAEFFDHSVYSTRQVGIRLEAPVWAEIPLWRHR
ncbi:MAG TPA: Wzz/FepE/Etk N-terminal domain-containing protein [Paludibaculum sp.]|jgi:uncharacterized protein involved in exopolysaccharide biosynthesis